jgi:hypothetical protein
MAFEVNASDFPARKPTFVPLPLNKHDEQKTKKT